MYNTLKKKEEEQQRENEKIRARSSELCEYQRNSPLPRKTGGSHVRKPTRNQWVVPPIKLRLPANTTINNNLIVRTIHYDSSRYLPTLQPLPKNVPRRNHREN